MSGDVITGGTITSKLKGIRGTKLKGIDTLISEIPTSTHDLCPLLRNGCPVNKGTTTLTISGEMPAGVPTVSHLNVFLHTRFWETLWFAIKIC